jgi:hypothetical protein
MADVGRHSSMLNDDIVGVAREASRQRSIFGM